MHYAYTELGLTAYSTIMPSVWSGRPVRPPWCALQSQLSWSRVFQTVWSCSRLLVVGLCRTTLHIICLYY